MNEEYDIPEIKLEIVSVPINTKPKKLEFGKFAVCSVCGNLAHFADEFKSRKTLKSCCKNSKVISLKEYVETVRKEKFIEENWKFEEAPDIVALHGIKAEDELVSYPTEEIKNERRI